MAKFKTTLPMKGISTPGFFIWILGFFHGHILRTGGVEPETNIISSSYITEKLKCFRSMCIARREQAELKLNSAWIAADKLIIDYAIITSAIVGLKSNDEKSSPIYAKERINRKRASLEEKRKLILEKIGDVVNEINTEAGLARDQMEATAELLLSTFACYGHGLLLEPVYTSNLPTVVYEDCAKQILTSHEETWNALLLILKGGKKI